MKKILNIISRIMLNPKKMIPYYFSKFKIRMKKGPKVLTLTQLLNYINFKDKKTASFANHDATIIVPVFNGLEHFSKMFTSLIENTNLCNILIIDDCSTDSNLVDYLDNIDNSNKIKIVRNKENLGFVRTINKAMKLVSTKYAIWVNSDVVLTKGWLDKILAPFENSNVASVTPFSNSATIFSFPYINKNNDLIDDPEIINAAFSRLLSPNPDLNNTLTGVGFCMAISMHAWNIIGELDEENFGKGYGEETDWCFRAINKGFINKLVPNLFIAHYHGGSFGTSEKSSLLNKHSEILVERYYKYMALDLPLFSYHDPWSVYRKAASLLLAGNSGTITFYANKKSSNKSLSKNEVNIVYDKVNKIYKLEFSSLIDPLGKNEILINNLREINKLKKLFNIKIVN